ncbi:MAG: phosphatase PAP2 family protein [Lewinellaceae bacterium]|nr:phosphatase PAP2 family protein [Lewinellaceae bacterium]
MTEVVIRRVSCGGGYSFTSSHAANHFAVAVFLAAVFGGLSRWLRPGLLLWAAVISFAQVYVGVHYPGDVLAGALLGAIIGWGIYRIGERLGKYPFIGD